MLPSPIAEPAAAKMNPVFDPQLSLFLLHTSPVSFY